MKTFKTFPETDCPRANALVVEPFCLGDFFIMEQWKDIEGFEGLYQVSNIGRVKSMAKSWAAGSGGGIKSKPETILNLPISGNGYYAVRLCKKGQKPKTYTVHRLVYEAFKGKTNLQIDHIIEGDKLNNRIENLQAVSNRKNTSKHRLTINKSSKYTGVRWHKVAKKWLAQIQINGKDQHLGTFVSEIEAAQAYQDKLKTL